MDSLEICSRYKKVEVRGRESFKVNRVFEDYMGDLRI